MVTAVRIDLAPRYEGFGTELSCEGVAITEKGTVHGLPLVDFRLRGPDGRFYLLVVTGRVVNAIAAAIRGANLRNHGVEEP